MRLSIYLIISMFTNTLLAASAQQLPNVLFILADDIGYSDIGIYGGAVPTPNIDRLARQGMRFTDAHSPAALCAPSRFSMLTGSYPYRSYNAGGAWNTNRPSIFTDPMNQTQAGQQTTVAQIMQAAGYRTAFFGKSHLGGDVRDQEGNLLRNQTDISQMDFTRGVQNSINEFGFDYSYSLPSGIQHEPFAFFENGAFAPFDPNKPANNQSTQLWSNGRYTVGDNGTSQIVEHNKRSPGIGDADYDSSQVGIMLVNKAVEFIDDHTTQNKAAGQQRPFLLYFASQAIHVPHTPPNHYPRSNNQNAQKVNGTTPGPTGDFIYELDVQVGKILQKIDDAGLTNNTLVFFTSDNGALWPRVCEYGDLDHDSNGPLRDYKASIYEGGHRVPFIVKWPGHVKPQSVSDELILAQDWVATMYEITNQPMQADQAMDSTSLLSLITKKRNDTHPLHPLHPLHPFVLYQAGFAQDGAIREGNWVLTVNRKNEAEELYNLRDDLPQANNLIDQPQHQQRIDRLHAKFLKYNDHQIETRDPRTTKKLP